MKRDIFLSIALHILIVTATLVASPFSPNRRFNPEDVIRVSLRASLPGRPAASPQAPAIVAPQPTAPAEKAKAISTKTAKKQTQTKPKKKRGVRPDEEARFEAQQYAEREIETQSTGEGSPFAGATIDNSNFNYPYWFEQAFNKIASNWRNTVDVEGTIVTVVYFQVLRSGRVMEARVDQSSGIDAFDQSCLSAIERSSPFPPLPREFADEIIGITLPFKFEPR